MNDNDLLKKGTDLIKKFGKVSSYVQGYNNYFWPKPSDLAEDYREALLLFEKLKDIKWDGSFESLILSELGVVLQCRTLLIENWMFQEPVSLQDHLNVLACGEVYFTTLNRKLESENAQEINKAGQEQYEERSFMWEGGIPESPRFLNQFDLLFEKTIETLFEISERYLGEDASYVEKLRKNFTFTYNYREGGYAAQLSHLHKTIFFDVKEIGYFEKGEVKLNYSQFILLFAHEVLGHSLHRIITDEAEELPEFLRIESSSSPWSSILKEEIARLTERSFQKFLAQNSGLLNRLDVGEDEQNLVRRIKRDFLFKRYFSDLEAHLFYTIIKDLETGVEMDVTRQKLRKVVYPTVDYFDNFYRRMKSLVNEKGKLKYYKLYYLNHAYHGIQGSKKDVMNEVDGKLRLNKKLLSGNWSNYGIGKWLELSENDKRSA